MAIITHIDSERRLRLPDEWGEEFPPDQEVELVHSDEGVLVKPVRRNALQAALDRKFPMNRPSQIDLPEFDADAMGW